MTESGLLTWFLLYNAGHPFHTEGLTCLSISHDSKIAITGSTDTKACIVNIQTGKVHVLRFYLWL